MAEGGTDDRPETEVSRDEDDTTTTDPVVDGIRKPTADESVECQSPLRKSSEARPASPVGAAGGITPWTRKQREYLRASDIRSGIDQPDKNLLPCRVPSNAIILGKEEIGAIGTSLIPALDRRTNGASGNSQEQLCRQPPLVFDLFEKGRFLLLVQGFRAGDGGIVIWGLGDDCTLAEERKVFA